MKIYEEGMLCKHFKGTDLLEKNIYRIIGLGVEGKDIDGNAITYTGDGVLSEAHDLVVYSNVFQDNKLFAREYADISSELSEEKSIMFNQKIRVQPLTQEEIAMVTSPDFIEAKKKAVEEKYKQR